MRTKQEIGSHYYWANYKIPIKNQKESRCHNGTTKEKQERKGFDISSFTFKTIRKDQVLRNCVEPEMGLYVFECAFKKKQLTLNNIKREKIDNGN